MSGGLLPPGSYQFLKTFWRSGANEITFLFFLDLWVAILQLLCLYVIFLINSDVVWSLICYNTILSSTSFFVQGTDMENKICFFQSVQCSFFAPCLKKEPREEKKKKKRYSFLQEICPTLKKLHWHLSFYDFQRLIEWSLIQSQKRKKKNGSSLRFSCKFFAAWQNSSFAVKSIMSSTIFRF